MRTEMLNLRNYDFEFSGFIQAVILAYSYILNKKIACKYCGGMLEKSYIKDEAGKPLLKYFKCPNCGGVFYL